MLSNTYSSFGIYLCHDLDLQILFKLLCKNIYLIREQQSLTKKSSISTFHKSETTDVSNTEFIETTEFSENQKDLNFRSISDNDDTNNVNEMEINEKKTEWKQTGKSKSRANEQSNPYNLNNSHNSHNSNDNLTIVRYDFNNYDILTTLIENSYNIPCCFCDALPASLVSISSGFSTSNQIHKTSNHVKKQCKKCNSSDTLSFDKNDKLEISFYKDILVYNEHEQLYGRLNNLTIKVYEIYDTFQRLLSNNLYCSRNLDIMISAGHNGYDFIISIVDITHDYFTTTYEEVDMYSIKALISWIEDLRVSGRLTRPRFSLITTSVASENKRV